MAGLSFLAKKSWHTSNLSNQEKVWLAEQKAQAEAQKVKELQNQIKLEREKEEFEKLAGKKSRGDRGVDWMYEEGGGPASGGDAELERAREEEKSEAYLLGKEYVPQGQEKHSGDFALAATMGGVLEKASTRGAVIGVGEKVAAKSDSGAAVLRLKDDRDEKFDDGFEKSEFNREFHLRHEDPMFAVHQKRERQRKEAEKKRNLMEKAGLIVKEVRRGGNADHEVLDVEPENKESTERSKKRKKHHKHHRRNRSSSSSSRSSSSSPDRRHRKKSERKNRHHRHDRRRNDRTRDKSDRNGSEDRYNHDNKKDSKHRRRDEKYHEEKIHSDRRDSDRHRHERARERSRSRDNSIGRCNEDKERSPRHHQREERYRYEDDYLDEYGRRKQYPLEKERKGPTDRHFEDRDQRLGKHGETRDRYDDREDHRRDDSRSSSMRRDRSPGRDCRHRGNRKESNSGGENDMHDHAGSKQDGYGLIGTALSGKERENSSNSRDAKQPTSLGPDEHLVAAKRQELEKERQARFDQARRRGGQDGRSREARERALEEMERNAKNRDYRHHRSDFDDGAQEII